jgi:chaperonin cofactor prefoldin
MEKKEDHLMQLQIAQQNLQNILLQKQQFQMQLNEFTSALSELKTTEKAYHIVGNLMVASKKEDLEKDFLYSENLW